MVHAGSYFPRLLAGAIGALFENAELVFPVRAVKTASTAIRITSGTFGLKAVKSWFLPHEQFKRPRFAVCKIHSSCASFPAEITLHATGRMRRVHIGRSRPICVFDFMPVPPKAARGQFCDASV